MSKIYYIIIGALLGGLLISFYFNFKQKKEKEALSKELYACINAPVKVDTIYDTIHIVEVKYIKPTPVEKDKTSIDDYEIINTSSVAKGCSKITPTYYSEKYESKGIKIHWEALAICENDSAKIGTIKFPDIVVPKEIITRTIEVNKNVEVEAKLKSKFLIYGGTAFNSFNRFPGVELGVGYLHKQNWGVQAGGIYLKSEPYISLKMFVSL